MSKSYSNLAIFQFATSSIHLATSIYLGDQSTKNHNVYYYFWPNATKMPNRMAKSYHNFLFSQRRNIDNFVNQINPRINLVHTIRDFDTNNFKDKSSAVKTSLSLCNTLMDLKNLDQITPGLGSALANEMANRGFNKNSSIDNFIANKLINSLAYSYLKIYFATAAEIRHQNISKAYIYNGRFLHERSAWEACKSFGVDVNIFENIRNRYYINSQGFHNRKINQKNILQNWQKSKTSLKKRMVLAEKYFGSFESKQNPFFKSLKIENGIVIPDHYLGHFSNSDKEAFGFWEHWHEPFRNQISAVNILAKYLYLKKICLVIRLHPNMVNDKKEELDNWLQFKKYKNVILVLPEDQISSYWILRRSLGVISYGSTIGIEAAWNLKPTAVLADCKYDELGVADKLRNTREMKTWINGINSIDRRVLNARKSAAVKWAYWIEESGTVLPNCTFTDKGWGAWEVLTYRNLQIPFLQSNRYLNTLIFKLKELFFKIS